ncbi:cell division protein ZipA C-terminal FtsZ-binding domain-containing protein [Marinospirillum sp.]|uniref:cell division protein ZipA C-terminal FtsZ-binding domain-containing protein n=1 Tax=Marinospirillum sp. TaxID=2183934 RepID=UPI003A88FFB1
MGLQLGLLGLGLAVFALILWDALRRRRRAAEEAEQEADELDPEEQARREQLERELPSLAASEQPRTRQDLDPLFDHIEVFDDDPIPVLTQKTPSPAQMLSEEQDSSAAEEVPFKPSLESMRALFSYDPGFAEASQVAAQERQQNEPAEHLMPSDVESTEEVAWSEAADPMDLPAPSDVGMAAVETDQSDLVDLHLTPPNPAQSRASQTHEQTAQQDLTEAVTELEKSTWKSAEEFITLNVTAQPGQLFSGALLLKVAQTIGLELSANGFYHYIEPQGTGLGYSLMNMYSPGRFDPSQLDQVATSGLVLVMPLPGPKDPKQVFERMLATAQIFEHNLQAELQDEQRSNLTQQTIEHYRQRIQDFERQRRLKKMKAGRHDAAAP